MRFLCAVAWRISETAMTFAIRFDPDMPAPGSPAAKADADRIRASMLHAVDVHRSRSINGHGLN